MAITTQDLNDFINTMKELREEMEGIALEAYKKGFLEGWNSCFKMYGSGETIKEDELSKYKTITELLSKCADVCKKEGGAKHDLKRKKKSYGTVL